MGSWNVLKNLTFKFSILYYYDVTESARAEFNNGQNISSAGLLSGNWVSLVIGLMVPGPVEYLLYSAGDHFLYTLFYKFPIHATLQVLAGMEILYGIFIYCPGLGLCCWHFALLFFLL